MNEVESVRPNGNILDLWDKMMEPLEERNGAYVFDLWRPKCPGNQERTINTGRFQALMESEENGNEGFVRQAGPR